MLRCPTKKKESIWSLGPWKYAQGDNWSQVWLFPSPQSRGKILCPLLYIDKEDGVWVSKPKLSTKDEQELIETAKERAALGIGYSKYNFMRAASAMAKAVQKQKSIWNVVETSKKKRNTSFSLRSPEATASNRHVSMTKERVGNFFSCRTKTIYSQSTFGTWTRQGSQSS